MKVGIVTQPLCSNYGGILQNYALQTVLKKLGHEPITLDYLPSLSIGRYILYAGKGVLCSFIPSMRHPIKPYRHYLRRPAHIDPFVRENVTLTKTIPDYSSRLLKKYGIEALILGSDQVWRYAYNSHYIEDMYLSFAKDYQCPKIAYGASFGIKEWDYPETRTNEVKKLIKLFDAISVREDSAALLCKEFLGIDPQVVLDPTLLLDASHYDRFCAPPQQSSTPYLAAYVLDMNDEKESYIECIAKTKNLIIRNMTVSSQGCSVEDWLSSIKNADYVITDSYHGTIFSVIFKKPLKVFINKERGADRFLSFMDKLGIQEEGDIDYKNVEKRLSIYKEQSLRFLSESLNK